MIMGRPVPTLKLLKVDRKDIIHVSWREIAVATDSLILLHCDMNIKYQKDLCVHELPLEKQLFTQTLFILFSLYHKGTNI